jgi:NAD(P)-dependent dehydrogenase (short-subunit alcohol dehydrogenase family)
MHLASFGQDQKFIPAEQVQTVKNWWVDNIPPGRIGRPSDIGKTAVYLASDDSSFMLGAEILVDGGVTNIGPANSVIQHGLRLR